MLRLFTGVLVNLVLVRINYFFRRLPLGYIINHTNIVQSSISVQELSGPSSSCTFLWTIAVQLISLGLDRIDEVGDDFFLRNRN